jgi:transposase
LRPLLDQELSMVFYDLTTLRTEGDSKVEDELRHYGMSKEGDIARQCLLGVVQTAEGLPIYHEVFAGNTAEATTLIPTLERVLSRFPIRRVIVVADRGLLSLDNLDALQQLRIGDQPLEFILAVPGRRYAEFAGLLQDFHTQRCAGASEEVIGEVPWQGFRLVIAHHPTLAAERSTARDQQIAALEEQAKAWAGKLDGQDGGSRYRGRKLSDGGVMARFHHAVSEAKLSRILRVDLSSSLFTYDLDEKALALARLMDGKLLLVTNVPDCTPADIVARYKALADIERGFRVLKSEIEIAPVFHRLSDRIRAHALICFLALILYRVLRMRLKAQHCPHSPERALEISRRIQLHQVTLHQRQTTSGITTLTPEQQELFTDLELPKPTINAVQATV